VERRQAILAAPWVALKEAEQADAQMDAHQVEVGL